MVLLILAPAVYEAIASCRNRVKDQELLKRLNKVESGSPVEHDVLIQVCEHLRRGELETKCDLGEAWRLDDVLKGAALYRPPSVPKPEPTSAYKTLMRQLREQEELKQYERMVNPLPPTYKFGKHTSKSSEPSFNPDLSHGETAPEDIDEVTYADVNRQLTLILNVLVSIIACGVAIWIGARHWNAPLRLALSMSGSGVVGVAEVAVYFGYIRRIKDAKTKEVKKAETKEIVETWVIDQASKNAKSAANGAARHRKGKQR